MTSTHRNASDGVDRRIIDVDESPASGTMTSSTGLAAMEDADELIRIIKEFSEQKLYTYDDPRSAVLIGVYIPLFVTSLVGNIFVLFIVLPYRRMRSVTHCFIVNLAVSDLLLTLVCVPTAVGQSIYRVWLYGETMCKVTAYMQGITVSSSVFTIAILSADRLLAIRQPMNFRIYRAGRHAWIIVAIVWVASLAVASPLLAVRKLDTVDLSPLEPLAFCHEIWPNQWRRRVYDVALFVILFAVPAVFVVSSYALIGRHLWTEDRDLYTRSPSGVIRSRQTAKILSGRRRIARMLGAIAVMFAICWMPYHILSLYLDFDPAPHDSWALSFLPFALLLGHSNSAFNPLLYCLMNRHLHQCHCRRHGGSITISQHHRHQQQQQQQAALRRRPSLACGGTKRVGAGVAEAGLTVGPHAVGLRATDGRCLLRNGSLIRAVDGATGARRSSSERRTCWQGRTESASLMCPARYDGDVYSYQLQQQCTHCPPHHTFYHSFNITSQSTLTATNTTTAAAATSNGVCNSDGRLQNSSPPTNSSSATTSATGPVGTAHGRDGVGARVEELGAGVRVPRAARSWAGPGGGGGGYVFNRRRSSSTRSADSCCGGRGEFYFDYYDTMTPATTDDSGSIFFRRGSTNSSTSSPTATTATTTSSQQQTSQQQQQQQQQQHAVEVMLNVRLDIPTTINEESYNSRAGSASCAPATAAGSTGDRSPSPRPAVLAATLTLGTTQTTRTRYA